MEGAANYKAHYRHLAFWSESQNSHQRVSFLIFYEQYLHFIFVSLFSLD